MSGHTLVAGFAARIVEEYDDLNEKHEAVVAMNADLNVTNQRLQREMDRLAQANLLLEERIQELSGNRAETA